MTNSRKENGGAKVCERREHQMTLGREARGLGLSRSPVTEFCHGVLSGLIRSQNKVQI